MPDAPLRFDGLSAVTFFTADMARAVAFYEQAGFALYHGGSESDFTSFHAGAGYINLMAGTPPERPWGRVIIHVSNVDAMYRRVCAAGLAPETEPADAPWGERYFHLRDPDGNELSFARTIEKRA